MDTNEYSFRIAWSAEDEAFVATCPEFDGVSGLGDSAEGALREARTALGLALETYAAEGWAVPPPVASQEHSGQFRLRIARSLHARLVQRAADEGVSLNALVTTFVAHSLGASDARAELPRCEDNLFSDLRGEIHRGFLVHASNNTAVSVAAGPSPLLLTATNVMSGGTQWQN